MMQRIRTSLLFIAMLALLSACSLGVGQAEPTTVPIILVATTEPVEGATPAQAPEATTAAEPTATRADSSGEEASPAPEATVPSEQTNPPPDSKGTITFAFDAFPSYYPGVLIEVEGLLAKRGYELELVPFGLQEQNDFSETERFEKLRSGEWDVLATTLDGFARYADPSTGAITTIIDESAGADKLVAKPEIATINDLRGQRIAYSEGSVGEFFLYYSLSLAGLGPSDVVLVPKESVTDAVAAYLRGEADAVSAWEPDVLEAEQAGAHVLIASDRLRAILDVLVSSRPSIDNKSEGLQAFHDAWYEALKLMTDNQATAEQALISWGHDGWSGIAAEGDLAASLESLAQANLGANQLAFRSSDLLVDRLDQAQTIWRNAGQNPPEADLSQMIDGRYVNGSGQKQELFGTTPPVNSSFLLTARIDLPQLSDQEQQNAQEVVQLPLEKIDFEPDSQRLTAQAMQDLSEQVLPVLRSSSLYLKIDGSSAWPGPEGRFSADEIREFALSRANSVATYLVQQGLNPNRLIIGALDPKFPNSVNEAELTQDRIVRFTLVAPAGR
jgi:ABC-type nitrate/sulfonate/bicarbonate transport system substrate-binding protein